MKNFFALVLLMNVACSSAMERPTNIIGIAYLIGRELSENQRNSEISLPPELDRNDSPKLYDQCIDLMQLRINKGTMKEHTELSLANRGINDLEKTLETIIATEKGKLGDGQTQKLLANPILKKAITWKSFDLSRNSLEKLPSEFNTLKNLESVILDNNQLTQFPVELLSLIGLKLLSLNNNEIQEIPSAIQNLENLEQLFLKKNQLKKLPDEIGTLKNLNNLKISGNPFEGLLPKSIFFLNLTNKNMEQLRKIQKSLKDVSKGKEEKEEIKEQEAIALVTKPDEKKYTGTKKGIRRRIGKTLSKIIKK